MSSPLKKDDFNISFVELDSGKGRYNNMQVMEKRMNKLKVIVTDDRHGSYEVEKEVLSAVDAELTIYDFEKCNREAREALRDADAVLCNLFPMNSGCIDSLEKCRIISRYGVGCDNVDTAAAEGKGIWVANVPDYACEEVSDHALALLLGAVRKISYRDAKIRQGEWNISKTQKCFRVKGSVLGLIGYGIISRALHRKISAFGLAKVLVYDPYCDPERIIEAGGIPASFEELIEAADYISIHAPSNKETKDMFNLDVFRRMKDSAIIINTARGPLINEEDLASALQNGEIAYAGLDVFEEEPLPEKSPLGRLDNVILSDHAGWYSEESIRELKTKAARNIVETFTKGRPLYPVNRV